MLRSFAAPLWSSSPVLIIGAFLAIQAAILPYVPGGNAVTAPLGQVGFVVVMAYLQNWSYSLSSRSAMRNSNAYHLLAAIVGSGTFFITFRFLALNNMPGVLFPAYLFATVLGSVHGQVISMYIEKRLKLDIIGTMAEETLGIGKSDEGDKNQFFRFWPSVVVRPSGFVVE